MLVSFLDLDIYSLEIIADLREWIFNSNSEQVGYEMTELIKKGSNMFLYGLYFESGTDPDSFELSQENFLHVSDEWKRIRKLMPPEVIITQDGDKIIFEYEV